jgi:hypothetical protein
MAGNSLVNARWAEIKVSIIAGGAMIMNIRDVLLAAVAGHGEGGATRAHDGASEGRRLGWTERELLTVRTEC